MWTIYPILPSEPGDPTILVTDDEGKPCCLARDRLPLLGWLYDEGLNEIGIHIGGEVVPFPIAYPTHAGLISASSSLVEWLMAADPHPDWPTVDALNTPKLEPTS